MAPLAPVPSARRSRRLWPYLPQGVRWMAPLAPVPSARPGTGLPTGPTDGAAGSRLSPTATAGSGSHFCCRRTVNRYALSRMHVHDEQVARHHARQAFFPLSSPLRFPFASSPPVGPRRSPPFCGCLCPALRALSHPSACCSRCPSLFPLCPVPSLARCTTLYQIPSPRCGIASIWAALAVPRDAAFPQPPTLHLYEPAPGPSQYSSVLDRDTARKLHATLHYCLLPRSLCLSLFPCLPCAYSWAPLCSLSLSRARYTTMCRAPSLPRAPAPLAVARMLHGNPVSSPAPLSVAF